MILDAKYITWDWGWTIAELFLAVYIGTDNTPVISPNSLYHGRVKLAIPKHNFLEQNCSKMSFEPTLFTESCLLHVHRLRVPSCTVNKVPQPATTGSAIEIWPAGYRCQAKDAFIHCVHPWIHFTSRKSHPAICPSSFDHAQYCVHFTVQQYVQASGAIMLFLYNRIFQ